MLLSSKILPLKTELDKKKIHGKLHGSGQVTNY